MIFTSVFLVAVVALDAHMYVKVEYSNQKSAVAPNFPAYTSTGCLVLFNTQAQREYLAVSKSQYQVPNGHHYAAMPKESLQK